MRIFVIGATGVIGARVVPALIANGHEVSAVSRSPHNQIMVGRLGARPVAMDLGLLRGHDAVINLATHIPPSSRALLPGAWRATNALRRELPPRIARAAQEAGVGIYIQESFAPAYPDCGDRWIDESVPLAPARYNRGVAAAEEAVASFAGRGIVLRFAYFYGEDSDFTRDMIKMVRRGWSPQLGSPDGYTSAVAHDDAAAAVVVALDLPSGTYNVVDDEPVTKRAFADAIADALSVKHPRFMPAWSARMMGSLGETLARSQRISNRKLRAESQWTPRFANVREGFRAVIAAGLSADLR